MIEKARNDDGKTDVTFAVAADSFPGTIYVVGDFNDWDAEGTPLTERDGEWVRATITVAADGRYAFRYRTDDGRWFNDEGADDYEPNEFGGSNGVILS